MTFTAEVPETQETALRKVKEIIYTPELTAGLVIGMKNGLIIIGTKEESGN